MPLLHHSRLLNLLILVGCLGLVGIAIFIEPFKSMDPCPMCMMQRAIFLGIALVCLLACLHNPGAIGRKIYGIVTALIAISGISVAGRQLWLQHLPEDRVPACGPGLEYMLDVFPLLEVIEMAIKGTGDCAKVQWTFAGVSIPGWSMVAFVGILIIAIWLVVMPNTNKNITK